jgi:hypothetical protein
LCDTLPDANETTAQQGAVYNSPGRKDTMSETLEATASPKPPQTISIGVDVIGQMKVLKKTFTDNYAFIGELLQNGDRAGAKTIVVGISKKRREIRFKNDGELCQDLNKVFTACTSGWSDAVKKSQEPFGVGFFSVIVVSGEVEIRSGTRKATWNIERMFAEETRGCSVPRAARDRLRQDGEARGSAQASERGTGPEVLRQAQHTEV